MPSLFIDARSVVSRVMNLETDGTEISFVSSSQFVTSFVFFSCVWWSDVCARVAACGNDSVNRDRMRRKINKYDKKKTKSIWCQVMHNIKKRQKYITTELFANDDEWNVHGEHDGRVTSNLLYIFLCFVLYFFNGDCRLIACVG